MPFKSLQRNLRINILAAFSVLLLLSFVLVGAAFNLAINQYIQSSAIAMLNDARALHYNALDTPSHSAENTFLRLMGNQRLFRTNLRFFLMDEDFTPHNPDAADSAYNIAAVLDHSGIILPEISNMRLRAHDNTYYISVATAPGELDGYTIFYVDVSDLQRFTRSINMLLLSFAGIIWFAAVIVTDFLAVSLAKPLHNLRDFAGRIGQGDFTPNPTSFTNEEFEALNQSLNHTSKQLAKYDNDQKTFFQNVSHELRTPLMTIESYAEGIKYGIMDPAKASQTIIEASERLSGMVGDILYISRIDNITAPALEATDINKLIQERINLQLPLAESKALAITFKSSAEPIIINCAASYMGRAIDNLISNAIRFAKSIITVECNHVDNQVVIHIKDDGPGFEPEALPYVFERFYKGKNGLSGIGLSVVRSIVEQHKGIAIAENDENGAKLTINIPL